MTDVVRVISNGGEVRLDRDLRFPTDACGTRGTFTLENIRDFTYDAEANGVASTDSCWFTFHHDGSVKHMYFPLEGHVDWSPPRKARGDLMLVSRIWLFSAAALIAVVAFLLGGVVLG